MELINLKLIISVTIGLLQSTLVYGQNNGIHPTATVANGQLVGKWQVSRAGLIYASYEGIPFAQPPVRFQSPIPAANWTGIRDASSTRSPCPQKDPINNKVYDATEDCLFLNVYVPKTVNASKTPAATVVWIHGGAFVVGSASFIGAKYFMDQDVILVSINYRLGALGFMNSANGLVEGNMGLKDQILALKWVQQNIRFFNGDAGNVTIFGESAGGASVHYLMISPAAKGLFHKVIAQSGSAISPWSVSTDPKKTAEDFVFQIGCGLKFDRKTLECLRKKSIKDVLDTQDKISLPNFKTWGPTIDTNSSDYSVVPAMPKALISEKYADQNSINVPLITGVMEDEGYGSAKGLLSVPPLIGAINLLWNSLAPKVFQYEQYYTNNRSAMDKVSTSIRKFYFNNQPVSENTRQNLSNLVTDIYFYMGMKHAALLHARTNPNVYTYNFRYRGSFSLADGEGTKTPHGPTHADDVQYLLNAVQEPKKNWPDLKPNSPDEKFSLDLVKLWTSFAKNSMDNTLRLGDGDSWTPLTAGSKDNSFQVYNLNVTSKFTKEAPEIVQRWEFLKSVFKGSPLEITV